MSDHDRVSRESEERLGLAMEIGELASWDWNVRTGDVTWNDRHFLLQGYEIGSITPSFEAWIARVHPDDRGATVALIDAARDRREVYTHEFRTVHPDGSVHWCSARGRFFYDEAGAPFRMIGVMEDVTQRKATETTLRESEEKYRTLFEQMSQGYDECEMVRDASGRAIDYRMLDMNPAFERLIGVSASVARGESVRTIIPGLEEDWIQVMDEIVRQGEPRRLEGRVAALDRWFEVYVYPKGGDQFAALFEDITERKRAEAARNEIQEQQAFLLELSDTLRAETGVEAVGNRAVQMIREKLKVDRVYLASLNSENDEVVITHETRRSDMSPLLGSYRSSDFPTAIREIFERTIVYDDVRTHPTLTELDRRSFTTLDAVGFAALAIRRGQTGMIGAAGAISTAPRVWTPAEIALLENAVERSWAAVDRARTEAALRDSEQRFQQFARASAAALWIRDATTLEMEYVSPAISSVYGVSHDDLLGDVRRWAALIVPEDRHAALEHMERARRGEAVVHEFRIQRPSDRAFRWIRNTDFPLFDAQGQVQRIGGVAEDVTEAKLGTQHQGVLLAELQHRVRNIMAVIRSMTNRTASGAQTVEDYRARLEGRLLALARVQTLLTREANLGGSLCAIIENEVSAQAPQRGQLELSGPDVRLSPKAVEVLTLAFHELSTNALKYGAFSGPEGKVNVRWEVAERLQRAWLVLDWVEHGKVPVPVTRRGFGSDLIEGRIPYELGGTGKISIDADGARCHLEFPLEDRESILETDAPKPAAIFGGSLDMLGAVDLHGRKVLVVEDDYYLAGDTAAALRGAGAEVMGPCPNERVVLDLLQTESPTHAVVDLNLGGGAPRFELAHQLQNRGVRFLILTGYDRSVIPSELGSVPRMQKPVSFRQIVEAVAALSA